MFRFSLTFLSLLVSLAVLWISQPGRSLGATALETVVSECRTRTGFGEATCQTLVKKYMTVERCQEYTSFSKEECAKKIEVIKQDPEFQGKVTPTPTPSVTKVSPTIPTPVNTSSRDRTGVDQTRVGERIRSVRANKEKNLLSLWERTEKMTEYLKTQGKDTASIEARFPIFEQKAEKVLVVYDTYLSVFEKTANESETTRRDIRSRARGEIESALAELSRYYRSDILGPLQTLNNENL